MKYIKHVSVIIIIASFFTNCSTAQKLQAKAPANFGDVYAHNWVAGVKGGGSGINVFIPIISKLPVDIELDSIYFQGRAGKLEAVTGEKILYVGRFQTEMNQQKDIIMSSDSKEEFGNRVHETPQNIPFELKDNECVISYKKASKPPILQNREYRRKTSRTLPERSAK